MFGRDGGKCSQTLRLLRPGAASGLALAGPALLCLASPVAAQPIDAEHAIAFLAPGIDPWRGGEAIAEERDYSIGPPRFDLTLPRAGISPLPALARALDLPFDPPQIGFAEMGGNLRGEAALRFGYRFTTGELNVVYPATVRLGLSSRSQSGQFAAGHEIVVTTAFNPGLPVPARVGDPCRRITDRAACTLSATALAMLAQLGAPRFTTRFPDARAYARFDYDVAAGFTVAAGIFRGAGQCFQCYSRTFSIRSAERVPLIDVSPQAVTIAGLGELRIADREIPVPPVGRIVFNYPDLRVEGGLAGGLDLAGNDIREVIRFEGAVERLVPVLGAVLRNSFGPVGYSLLETNAGPSLSLRQSFRIAVVPRVTLHFSQSVDVPGRGRQLSISAPIGQPIRFRPTVAGTILITPTYDLEMTITNETGLALGYRIDFGGLRLTMGPADVGPVRIGIVQDRDVVRPVTFCCAPFRVQPSSITASPIQIALGSFGAGAGGTDPGVILDDRGGRFRGRRGSGQIGDSLGRGPQDIPSPLPPQPQRPDPAPDYPRPSPLPPQPRRPDWLPNFPRPPRPAPYPPDERPDFPRPRPEPSRDERPDIDAGPLAVPGPPVSTVLTDARGGPVFVSALPEWRNDRLERLCPGAADRCISPRPDMTPQVIRREATGGPTVDMSTTHQDPRRGRTRSR